MSCCSARDGWMCKDDRKGGFRTLDLAKDVKLAVSKSTKLDLKRYKRGDGRGGYQLRDGWHWATRAEAEVLLEAARAKSRIAQLRERESLYAMSLQDLERLIDDTVPRRAHNTVLLKLLSKHAASGPTGNPKAPLIRILKEVHMHINKSMGQAEAANYEKHVLGPLSVSTLVQQIVVLSDPKLATVATPGSVARRKTVGGTQMPAHVAQKLVSELLGKELSELPQGDVLEAHVNLLMQAAEKQPPCYYLNRAGWDGFTYKGRHRTFFIFRDSLSEGGYLTAQSYEGEVQAARTREELRTALPRGSFAGLVCARDPRPSSAEVEEYKQVFMPKVAAADNLLADGDARAALEAYKDALDAFGSARSRRWKQKNTARGISDRDSNDGSDYSDAYYSYSGSDNEDRRHGKDQDLEQGSDFIEIELAA